MTKTTKTTRKAAPHTKIMGAVTKSLSDGRMRAFMDNPSNETRDAIVDQVRANLTALLKGKKVAASKPAKVEKTEKISKPARKTRVPAAEQVEKISRAVLKRAQNAHNSVIRLKDRTDDSDKIKRSVERLLTKNGLNVESVRASGTALVTRSGHQFRVKFNTSEPNVSYVGAA